MEFTLPRLTGWVRVLCYPGMEIECWLNYNKETDEYPSGKEAWETAWWALLGDMFLRLKVPAEFNKEGQEAIIELGTAKAVYDLLRMPGFDKSVIQRILGYLGSQRETLIAASLGNSDGS